MSNASEKGCCVVLLNLIPFSSLYYNSDLEAINDANDFAEAMERQVNAGQQNAHAVQYSNGHKLVIIFVNIF